MPTQPTQQRLPRTARHGSTEGWPPVLAAPAPEPVQLFALTVLALRRHAPFRRGWTLCSMHRRMAVSAGPAGVSAAGGVLAMTMESIFRTDGQAAQVPCMDVFDRGRAVAVWSGRRAGTSQIVLVAPPGEAARLTAHEARALAEQLLSQADRLDGRHRVVPLRADRAAGDVVRFPAWGERIR